MVRLDAPTEITYFDDVAFLDEYIFWFDIPMDEALLMHIIDARAYLDEEVEGGIFT